MRKMLIGLLFALPLGALAGCAAEEEPAAAATQALGGFTFDSRAISTPPPATLPAAPLPRTAFEDGEIIRSLIQTTEGFTPGERSGDVTEMDSASWMFQKLQSRGLLIVQRTVDPGPPVPQDDAVMQRLALGRLAAWGVPSQEIVRVLQRRGMQQDGDDSGVSAPEVHRYKTFALRGINGVPIEGHRATLSHAVDGTFHRALVNWPPLAAAGHKLTTRLSVSEIEQRAARALTAEGETDGAVKLRWRYTAEPTVTGEAVLTLKVSARLGAVHNREYAEEPREITVAVDAL